jgi:hypothetical protein
MQDIPFNLRLIDQNSTEPGTSEFFREFLTRHIEHGDFLGKISYLEFFNTGFNRPLNHLWNDFVAESSTPFCCILNNDVRVLPNFLSSALEVLKREPSVGFVNHTTNSKEFSAASEDLVYEIIDKPYRQGWDFIFRKECFVEIPEQLTFFYGDDYIYSKLYSSGKKAAYVLNSPMLHFERSTTEEKNGVRDLSGDREFYLSLGLEFRDLSFHPVYSKWKPEFQIFNLKEIKKSETMKRAYITHVTEDYIDVANNLAKSLAEFSEIPLFVYILDGNSNCEEKFSNLSNVHIRHIRLDIDSSSASEDYVFNSDGNFYISRRSPRIYKILCAKTLAMEMALEEGIEEVCYLDSDCIASPIVDELFDWMPIISDYPICTEGIHQYMIIVEESGFERGNPFEGTWPASDNKKALEWPLMNFLQMTEFSRGTYRTTGIMLMNKKCLNFIKVWREFCFMLTKLNVDLYHYAAYHEETIYNVLSWKKSDQGFPLCYVNLRNGLQTVRHFYEEGQPGFSTYMDEENKDYSLNFYSIPSEKRNVKLLHGEKRPDEIEKIIDYLKGLKNSGYFNKF